MTTTSPAAQTLPTSLTPDAVSAVAERLAPSETEEWLTLEAQALIFRAAQEARDAWPKWELHTLEVEGVTLQMRYKEGPCARFVVTID